MEESSTDYRKLMAYYECAIMEVETKFKVLSKNFSLGDECNPIESIQSRLKSTRSIFKKMQKKGLPLTVEAIESNLHDIAGVRVICSTISDIYTLADAFIGQDDVFLVERKDYIAEPKENGYRSLHLVVKVPVFLSQASQRVPVEVQMRTVSMDLWASVEHQISYKRSAAVKAKYAQEMMEFADDAHRLDLKIQDIWRRVNQE